MGNVDVVRVARCLDRVVEGDVDSDGDDDDGDEIEDRRRDDPGHRRCAAVADESVRAYFTRRAAEAPGWFRAESDPVVGRALRLMQDNPAEPWTLASLARETHVSRATLARRFTEIVGQPPIAFLTEWRLALAADLILDPSETIASVASKVGYRSAYALSTAFKRVRGVRPGRHRAGQRLRSAYSGR